ncbi:putative 2-(R)-hydroxypropyl-CoM dehydrogenase [Mytilinidion resinicola]|uniref:2-(R)-hydroxypropyl-CoM dehydrogenase n=1 Tax=Mytilinidion resinicola TaxID=574789 RepID=A0A6A6Y598_9PEZI|nr:putative 2-(R)-hydroxypropyl-CoM dehydrogenase [Mytilinidion resinicola]KAF2803405.1 putative 2-(R)-hydroxypropyl-CoM dehydrogenase [Mytilinidion resinicola]
MPPQPPSHLPRLHDKTALITGASSGIGRAIAIAYASHGTKLVVCADLRPDAHGNANTPEDKEKTHDLINKRYGEGRAVFVRCDVAEARGWEEVVSEAVRRAGRLDVLVNNAGVGEHNYPRLHLMDEAIWDKTMAVNARGVFLGCKYALVQFLKQPPHPSGDRGWIINIASTFGINGFTGGHGPYCASKAACLNLSKSIALDYAADKIHCNAICPGFTQSAMTEATFKDEAANAGRLAATPWGRWGRPEEIAAAAVFLASEDSSFVTGVGLPVDGGYLAM